MKAILTPALLVLAALLASGVAQDQGKSPATKPAQGSAAEDHSDEMAHHMKKMNKQMVKALGQGDGEYEKRFIDMMIPHHEGAVLMSEHALQHATQPELKEMAKKMIESQKKEIAQLREWRKKWYGATLKQ